MIYVFHNQNENVVKFVAKLRDSGKSVCGCNLKYFNGRAESDASAVYSASFNQQLQDLYGDKYKLIPGRKKKKNGNDK